VFIVLLVFTEGYKTDCSNITVTSHVQNVSVIPLSRLSPYVTEITADLDELDWAVIRDSAFIRCLKKTGM